MGVWWAAGGLLPARLFVYVGFLGQAGLASGKYVGFYGLFGYRGCKPEQPVLISGTVGCSPY
jgi:hypothetical protein